MKFGLLVSIVVALGSPQLSIVFTTPYSVVSAAQALYLVGEDKNYISYAWKTVADVENDFEVVKLTSGNSTMNSLTSCLFYQTGASKQHLTNVTLEIIQDAFIKVLQQAPKDIELYKVTKGKKGGDLDELMGGSDTVAANCALALGQEGFLYLLRAYGSK